MPKFLILGRYGALLALISPLAWSGAPPADDTALTIYSSARPGAIPPEYYRPLPGQGSPNASGVPGFAMVRHEREVQLTAGRTQLQFTDVAALIDPTTVTFTSLTEPGARVLEQNFQFDLVSTDKLLLKYIDRPVTVERSSGATGGSVTGTLLSSADGLVLRGNDGAITALRDYSIMRFPELPGGLISRPTLQWDISATRAGAHRARVTYQTGGVTWWADYNLIYQDGKDAGNGFVDLSSWVSIINQSGATYPEAKLKLIAGDVHRAQPPAAKDGHARDGGQRRRTGSRNRPSTSSTCTRWGDRTSLPNNSTKQIELFDQAHRVPAQRLLVFANGPGNFGGTPYEDRNFPATGNTKVATYLQFRNDKASGLGVPLPAGRMRVSRLDAADNSLEFIGEDVIDHTPRDERVRVQLGSAFDVVGERKQVDVHQRQQGALDGRGSRGRAAQSQGRSGGSAGSRIPVPLEHLADPQQQRRRT